MKGWLVAWLPVAGLFAALLTAKAADPVGAPLFCGLIYWLVGIGVAQRTTGRGALAGLSMATGVAVTLLIAALLANQGLPDREALTLVFLGLTAGLQLALGRTPVAALLGNLGIYWALVGAAVATASENLTHAAALAAVGPPALLLPALLLGTLRRHRGGEQVQGDLRHVELKVRFLLGVIVTALMLGYGFSHPRGSGDVWMGLAVVGFILLARSRH